LSEIETALLDQVTEILLLEWCRLWPALDNARPVLLGHENNGRFLSSSPHDSVLVLLSIEVRLGDCVETMHLAFPFLTIEPLLQQPGRSGDTATSPAAAKPARLQWNRELDDVRIRVNTEWHGLELSARELAGLKAGDVLMLDAGCFDRVDVRFEQVPKYHGRLGTSGNHWAVELTDAAKD